MFGLFVSGLALLLTLSSSKSFSQDKEQNPDGGFVLKAETRLVQVPVRLKQRKSNVVATDFQVLVNGRKQDIKLVEPQKIALNVVLVIDISGSVSSYFQKVGEAVQRFVGFLPAETQVSVVTFNHDVRQLVPFTSDSGVIRSAISSLQAAGSTRAFDGVAFALGSTLRLKQGQTSLIVFFSDGMENSSSVEFDKLTVAAQSTSTIFFPILFQDGLLGQWSSLAQKTGGELVRISSPNQVDKAYEKIEKILSETYLLTFYPDSEFLPNSPRFYPLSISFKGSSGDLVAKKTLCLNARACTISGSLAFSGPPTLEEARQAPFNLAEGETNHDVLTTLKSALSGAVYQWTDDSLGFSPEQSTLAHAHCPGCKWTTGGYIHGATDTLIVGLSPDSDFSRTYVLKRGMLFAVTDVKVGFAPCRSTKSDSGDCKTDDGNDLYFTQIRLEAKAEGRKFSLVCQWPRAALDASSIVDCENLILKHAERVSNKGEGQSKALAD